MSDTATINKWGNSLGLRLPKSYCEHMRLAVGDEVSLSLEDDRIIIASPIEQFTLRARMQNWNGQRQKTEEVDWGGPVGKEVW